MGLESLPPTAYVAIIILLVANVLIFKFLLKRGEKKVSEFMASPVVTVAPGDTLEKASKLMADKQISCVVVENSGKPVGILTERDINRFYSEGKPKDTKVEEVMSQPVEITTPDTNIEFVVRKMITKGIRRVPVVKEGKLVGIVTESDIVKRLPDLVPRVKKNLGWDYVDPRVKREMDEWLDRNASKSWEELRKEFPKWYATLEERNMVREGEERKIYEFVKREYEKRKSAG
jgi:CBS domain-containing protein